MTQQKTTLTLHKIHNWPNKPSLVLKIHSYMKRCCRFDQPGATVVCRVGHQMGREISPHVKGNHKVNYLQVWHLGFPTHTQHGWVRTCVVKEQRVMGVAKNILVAVATCERGKTSGKINCDSMQRSQMISLNLVDWVFYRTQVNLGSDSWVRMSVRQ